MKLNQNKTDMQIHDLTADYLNYLENINRYSANTLKAYSTDLSEFFEYCTQRSKEKVSQISERFIKSYMMTLSQKELDKKSISRKLSSLRGLFKYAFTHDLIEFNPVSTVGNPKSSRKLPEITTTESILKIYEIVEETEKDPDLIKAIIELLYGCALRVDELCKLNYSDLDLKQKIVKVWGKGSKMRIVPVGQKSIKILKNYLHKRDYLNPGAPLLCKENGQRIYSKMVYRIVNKYLSKVSDIKKKSPHILRHSAATHMLDRGADLGAVKEILGHENLSTTQIYTHVSVERLKSTYKKSHPKS